ncbi:MAG: hypothetical protein RR461_03220, partial [Angelakisella sp.]
LTEKNLDRKDVFLTARPYFCEECGKPREVIISIADRQTPFFYCAPPCPGQGMPLLLANKPSA